jgi:Tol biopolymer transport system component
VSLGVKWFGVFAVLGSLLGLAGPSSEQETAAGKKRPITVAGVIGMTRIAGTQYPAVRPKRDFAVFSPDGKHFAIVLSKGNVGKNTNDYCLLLFRTRDVFRDAAPTTLALFSSSSNRMGISDVTWSKDNDTIFFLGARRGQVTQLYSVRSSSRELRKLTSHSTSLTSYAIAQQGERIVYAADEPERDLINGNSLRHGLHVTTESLSDLIKGQIRNYEPELFVKGNASVSEKRLHTQGPFDNGINNLFLSPDGRYLVLKTDTTEIPESWRRYEDPAIQMLLRHELPKGVPTRILRYEVIDMRTGRSEVLLDSPATYQSCVLWSPDSKSLLLCETYLPLDGGGSS